MSGEAEESCGEKVLTPPGQLVSQKPPENLHPPYDFVDICQHLIQQFYQLRNQNNGANEEGLRNITKELEDLKEQLAKYKDDFGSLLQGKELSEKLQEEIHVAKEERKKEVGALTADLSKAKEEIKRLNTQISCQKGDLAFKIMQHANVRAQLVKLGKARNELQQSCKKVEAESEELERQVLKHEAECKAQDDKIIQLTEEKSEIQRKMRGAASDLGKSGEFAETMIGKSKVTEAFTRAANEQGEKFQHTMVEKEETQHFTVLHRNLAEQLKEIQKKLKEKDEQLVQTVEETCKERDELNAEINEKNIRIAELEKLQGELTEKLDKTTKDLEDGRRIAQMLIEELDESLERPTLLRQLILERIAQDAADAAAAAAAAAATAEDENMPGPSCQVKQEPPENQDDEANVGRAVKRRISEDSDTDDSDTWEAGIKNEDEDDDNLFFN